MPGLPGALRGLRSGRRAADGLLRGEGTWCHHRIRARRGPSAGTGTLTGPARTAKVPKPAPPPPRLNHRPILSQGAKDRPGNLQPDSNHSSQDTTTGNHPWEGSSNNRDSSNPGSSLGDRRPGSSRLPDRGQPGAHPPAHTLEARTRKPHTRAALLPEPRIPEHSTAAPTASRVTWLRPSQASFRSAP